MEEPPDFVGLAEVIRQIRGELEQARDDGQDHHLGFSVEKVSLEFTVQVHRSGSARGGLRIGVLTAEAGGSAEHGTTHRVQIDLLPEWQGGRLQVRRQAH